MEDAHIGQRHIFQAYIAAGVKMYQFFEAFVVSLQRAVLLSWDKATQFYRIYAE
jgi:hypothetical protein